MRQNVPHGEKVGNVADPATDTSPALLLTLGMVLERTLTTSLHGQSATVGDLRKQSSGESREFRKLGLKPKAEVEVTSIGAGAANLISAGFLALIFLEIFFGHVILGYLARSNLSFVGIVSLFYAGYNSSPRLERPSLCRAASIEVLRLRCSLFNCDQPCELPRWNNPYIPESKWVK
jgi:hypothetical protein